MNWNQKIFDKIRKNVLFHEKGHFLLSFVIGLIFWLFYKDLRLMFISLLAGFFIDVDHFFDYFCFVTDCFKKWTKLNIKLADFFNPSLYVHQTKKVYVLLHGWEYLFVLLWLIFSQDTFSSQSALVFLFSYFVHLVYDQISSAGNLFAYSLIYRALHKFDLSAYGSHEEKV